jgi:glycosyltransferase involved in cell wall biosynthesis
MVPRRSRSLVEPFPGVSLVIPTLNAGRVLDACLRSVFEQDYPAERLEVIVVDGGSSDWTIEIASGFSSRVEASLRIIENPLRTGEAGKAAGLRAAGNEYIAFIDSDNLLPHRRWLREMVAPLEDDRTLVASEPLEFTYRGEDGFINRYCAMMGMNDPICLFLGNYDRKCAVTNRWTGLAVEEEEREGYLSVTLRGPVLPTIGANGFVVRKGVLEELAIGPYLFDVEILRNLVKRGGEVRVAKVKTGIVHLYSRNYAAFSRKQRRRILDYYRHRGRERPREVLGPIMMGRLLLFILSCLTVLPLIAQGTIGFCRRPDSSWLFHPVACWTTFLIYSVETVLRLLDPGRTMQRVHWSQ